MSQDTISPKVTVCVPVYNVEQYIQRCITSLQTQTLKDIEIIVVDDCSPDLSGRIVEDLATSDDRISIIRHQKNIGPARARETAYKKAKGDYVTFCDGDDALPPNALETLYHNAVEQSADIVSGNMSFIHLDGTSSVLLSVLKYGSKPIAVYQSLLRFEFRHNLCSKLFKTALLQDYVYDTRDYFTHGEDGFLFYQIVQNASKTIQIDDIVYHYHQNLQSSSNVNLSFHALECVIVANTGRVKACSHYPELTKDLQRAELSVMSSVFRNSHGQRKELQKLIKEYGLYRFISLKSIITCGNWRLMLKALYYIHLKGIPTLLSF